MNMAHGARGGFWLVPDRVAANQEHYDESRKPFPANPCDSTGKPTGRPARMVILRGDLYGLHTTGTGDMVVSSHNYRKGKV